MQQSTAMGGPQHSLGRFESYGEAERLVDSLSDKGFPVERVMIVGSDLRLVEDVTGRLTSWRAALAGAGTGAWFGLLVGLVFWIVSPWAAGAVLSAMLLGAVFGAAFGAVAHWSMKGRRDFASVSRVQPLSFEVLVEAGSAEEAQRLLAPPVEERPKARVTTTRRTKAPART